MPIYLNGLGLSLPGTAVNNRELAQRFALNEEWIALMLGNHTRHFATNLLSGEQMFSLADLGFEAAQKALADASIDATQLDFLILASATPDQLMPATVNQIAHRLKLANVPTYQLQSGCSGAIQALDLANELIKGGRHRCGLVIGADVCNKFINPALDYTLAKSSELINYALFGDGAGAAVLSSDAGPHRLALTEVHYAYTGRDWDPGQVVNWRGSRPEEGDMLQEDYKAIESKVPMLAEEVLQFFLNKLRTTAGDVQWYLPPQLSGKMTQHIIDYLDLPTARTVNCVADTGNNGNALPFFQIGRLLERIEAGQQAIAIAIESSRWLRGGFVLTRESTS